MKTTFGKQNLTAAVAAALVVVLLTGTAALAGDGKRVIRTRNTTQTQVIIRDSRDSGATQTPRPVVDETPIRPKQISNTSAPQNTETETEKPSPKKPPLRRR